MTGQEKVAALVLDIFQGGTAVFKAGWACDIFDLRGIDRERGGLIVVRPDQYIAHVLPLDGQAELSAFFAGILR